MERWKETENFVCTSFTGTVWQQIWLNLLLSIGNCSRTLTMSIPVGLEEAVETMIIDRSSGNER